MTDRMALAREIIDYTRDVDPFGIVTNVNNEDAEHAIAANPTICAEWLEEQADEYDDDRARDLLARVSAI